MIGTRTDPTTLPFGEVPGKSDLFGEFGGFFGLDSFFDLRLATDRHPAGLGLLQLPRRVGARRSPSNPNGFSGPASNAGTYNYQPISGVRDILGYIRVDDPNVPGVGFGSNPFLDIGAYRVRQPAPARGHGRHGDRDQRDVGQRHRDDPVLHGRRQGGQQHRRR